MRQTARFTPRLGGILKWLLVGLCAALVACESEQPEPVEYTRAIKTYTVGETGSGHTNLFPGVVIAEDDTVLSFEVAGNVRDVFVDVGDLIETGQVLATLDPKTFQLQVTSSQASLEKAKASYVNAKKDLERLSRIFKRDPGATSRADLDRAQADYESAKSQVDLAKSELKLAQRDLEKTKLHAPFDGAVSTRHVEPRFEVRRGQEILDVYASEGRKVEIQLPEVFRRSVAEGQTGEVTFIVEPEKTFTAEVSLVGSAAGEANTFPLQLRVENPTERILPGVTADVRLELDYVEAEQAYLVPLQAFVGGTGANVAYVFVFQPESSTVRKTAIKGVSFRENSALVTEGLKEGDRVAVAGVNFLQDGQQVNLLPED